MYPCPWPGNESPALYTFYALATLVVVILAISLVWNPFVHLFRELNTIFARVIIYMNKEMFGYKNACFFSRLETLLTSHVSLYTITFCCIVFALYLASGDVLRFAGCYICNWPNSKALENIKKRALEVIEYLLNLTGNQKSEQSTANAPVNFRRRNKNVGDRTQDFKNVRQIKPGHGGEPRKRAFVPFC